MLRFYLNRELADRLHIPLNRWKRWSREFLPPDPLGGLQSGFARQYSLRDAFTVYLAGYLVSETGFSIPEARKILEDINGWLKKNLVAGYESATGGDVPDGERGGRIDLLILPVAVNGRPAFSYRIRRQVERRLLSAGDVALWQERYTEEVLKPAVDRGGPCYPICARRVALSVLFAQFFDRLASP